MQNLSCTIGHWHAEARMQELDKGKLMAVIRMTDDSRSVLNDSRHTIVFDPETGQDRQASMEMLVRRLLRERYKL